MIANDAAASLSRNSGDVGDGHNSVDADFFPASIDVGAASEIEALIARILEGARALENEIDLFAKVEKHLPDVIVHAIPAEIDSKSRSRLVPLNAAVMAAHLLTARYAFNRIPTIVRDQLIALVEKSASAIVSAASLLKLVSSLVSWIVSIAQAAYFVYKFDALVAEVKGESKHVREELVALLLRPDNPRETRKVYSRHR